MEQKKHEKMTPDELAKMYMEYLDAYERLVSGRLPVRKEVEKKYEETER